MNLPAITSEFTKSHIKITAKHFIQEVLDSGRVIDAADLLAKMEMLIKEMRADKDFIDSIREEVGKYGKTYTTTSGTKIELAEVGTKYDFSKCGDYELYELESQMAIIEEQIKAKKEFLKMLPLSGIEIIDTNGEVHSLYPPTKTSTSSIKTTINK